MGLLVESDGLRDQYLSANTMFDAIFNNVGQQFLASGYAVPINQGYTWEHRYRTPMLNEGHPSKVVVDVVREGDENSGRSGRTGVRPNFWTSKKPSVVTTDNSDDLPGNTLIEQGRASVNDAQASQPEIPVHPLVPIYHLGRHTRHKIHVGDLEEYQFDHGMGDNLVLPALTKQLVNTLIGQGRVSFQDIIEGKGAGACVLLGGPPGVGKTLTAEVFAEATERPLLSVQAAQLGTDPDKIESNLVRVLNRGSRWNAVVLLDEADVYIHERGTNLQQNAIVAAFLRVLERHTATIFMTTNHIRAVDDAIASRCIARIDYDTPTREQQREIWTILNHLNASQLSPVDIDLITSNHHDLTGRDIKQILKLASLWAANHGTPIDPEVIDFVKQFVPSRPSTNGVIADVTGIR